MYRTEKNGVPNPAENEDSKVVRHKTILRMKTVRRIRHKTMLRMKIINIGYKIQNNAENEDSKADKIQNNADNEYNKPNKRHNAENEDNNADKET